MDAKDKNGQTPLHVATQRGYASIVTALIHNGAHIDEYNVFSETPLLIAADVEIVSILLENGASVNNTDNEERNALHRAALQGNAAVVSVLLENGASIEALDPAGSTALHLAASEGHVDAVSILLQNGASIKAVNYEEFTALHCAAFDGHALTLCYFCSRTVPPSMLSRK